MTGYDAAGFVQHFTLRNMAKCTVDRCRYALVTAADGGIVSDPIILRVDEKRVWPSTSDRDLEL